MISRTDRHGAPIDTKDEGRLPGTVVDEDHGHLRQIVLVAIHSGLRLSEILNLTWQDVDIDRGILTVVNSKSGKSRHIPMNRTLTGTLLSVTRLVGSPYVFCKADGTPYGSINMGFRAARKRVDLERRPVPRLEAYVRIVAGDRGGVFAHGKGTPGAFELRDDAPLRPPRPEPEGGGGEGARRGRQGRIRRKTGCSWRTGGTRTEGPV